MIPSTATRVETNTSPEVNARIAARTRDSISLHEKASVERVRERLFELDREWDVERMLEAGKLVDRRFYLLTAAVGGFLLQHAVQGWCPPLPVLRRLGFRTASEIETERRALRRLLEA
jgi:hypothetical protein